MTRAGYKQLLDCPACGNPCKELPPYAETPQYRFPWWQDGDYAVCACGADLIVVADGEVAYLKERDHGC
jgi:hypothetical protein